MENELYCFYNRLSCRYGDVVAFPTEAFAIARLKEAKNINFNEVELCRIGTININNGVVTPCSPVRVDIPVSIPTIDEQATKLQ